MTLLITGVNGFVGSAFLQKAREENRQVTVMLRSEQPVMKESSKIKIIRFESFKSISDWSWLNGITSIVHCAGVSSCQKYPDAFEAQKVWEANVEFTEVLVKAGIEHGVRKFIFLSSAKVYGESTFKKIALTEDQPVNPVGYYAITKCSAEQAVRNLCHNSGMRFVILRLPLVVGEGARGNLKLLQRLVSARIPLPLKGLRNRRSVIGLMDLSDLIWKCLVSDEINDECFNVSNGKSLASSDLIRLICRAKKQNDLLFYIPNPILRFSPLMLSNGFRKLIDSFEVDSSSVEARLGWVPRYGLERDIEKMVGSR